MPAEAYDEAYRSISNAGFVLDNMAASKSQPIANEFKLARSAGHDFAGYPAFCGRDLSVRVGVARTLNHNPEQNTP